MSPQSKDEYTAKTRISAILDTRADDVQFVGGMSNGDRQYFPLQLWQNHRTTNQQGAWQRRSTSICWRSLACTSPGCTDHWHQVRFVFDKLEVCEAQSPQAVC